MIILCVLFSFVGLYVSYLDILIIISRIVSSIKLRTYTIT